MTSPRFHARPSRALLHPIRPRCAGDASTLQRELLEPHLERMNPGKLAYFSCPGRPCDTPSGPPKLRDWHSWMLIMHFSDCSIRLGQTRSDEGGELRCNYNGEREL